MNKTNMISIYQGIEYKLIKQQEAHVQRTGMTDEELTRKIQLIQGKVINCQISDYAKWTEADRAFMAEKLQRYGIFI